MVHRLRPCARKLMKSIRRLRGTRVATNVEFQAVIFIWESYEVLSNMTSRDYPTETLRARGQVDLTACSDRHIGLPMRTIRAPDRPFVQLAQA